MRVPWKACEGLLARRMQSLDGRCQAATMTVIVSWPRAPSGAGVVT